VQPLGPGRWWAYPGNLQGRSTKATECGPKGALVVPILSDGFGEPQFHACDTVRFVRSDLDMSQADNLGDTLDLVSEHMSDLEHQAGGRSLVARVRLTGATAAHGALSNQVNLVHLAREHHPGSGLLATVEVATRPRVERAQVVARENLQSDVIRAIDAATDPTTALLDLLGDQLKGPASARLQQQLSADPDLAGVLLTQVETLLTELLEDPS